MKKILTSLVMVLIIATGGSAFAATDAPMPPPQDWPHHGPFGTYDKAATQRGLQVYLEVCASCHSLRYVSYRNLMDLGYTDAQAKTIASEYSVIDGPDDEGELFERTARPSDRFISPFKNDQAARAANGGALPVDLSLVVKSRKHGEDYIYALLTGYETPPEDVKMQDGMHFNKYFPGHQIAMAAPIMDGQITYSDGLEASIEQAARDVTQFLAWAAEPYNDQRKKMGVKVLLYLLIFAGILYAVKRKIWSDVH